MNKAGTEQVFWTLRFFRASMLAAGILLAAAGAATLMAWILGWPERAHLQSGVTPMAPSAAVLFILFGCVFGLQARHPTGPRARRLSLLLVSVVGLVSTFFLLVWVRRIYWDIEHAGLVFDHSAFELGFGHMPPLHLVSFLAGSLSFLIAVVLPTSSSWRSLPASALASFVLGLSFAVVFAELNGVPLLVHDSIHADLTSSLVFMVLGFGLIVLPGRPSPATVNISIPPSYLVASFALLCPAIVSAGFVYYRNFERQFREDAEERLNTVALLKTAELMHWRHERLGDGNIFFDNAAFGARVRIFLGTPANRSVQEQLRTWIGKVEQYGQYDEFRLLDAKGVTRLSDPPDLPPTSKVIADAATAALQTKKLQFMDFYRHDREQQVYLAVVVPLYDDRDTGNPLGTLVLRINPAIHLYPLIQRWPGNSRSAEIVLSRREENRVIALNTLRHRPDAALNLSLPLSRAEVPGVRAAFGATGYMEGIDYRGIPVIASVSRVPDSPWNLIAKMDKDEANAPLRERLWGTVIFDGVVLLATGAMLGFVWRRQRDRHFLERFEAERALRTSEGRFQRILEAVSLLGVVLDTKGAITLCNDYVLSLTGWKREEVMGRNWFELFLPPEIRDGIERQIFQKSIAAGQIPIHFENEIMTRQGARRLVLWNNSVLRDPDGTVIGVASLGSDVTELRRAESALRESENRFRRLAENARDMIYRFELKPERRFSYVSPVATEITGYSPDEHYADPDLGFKLVHPDDRPLLAAVAEGRIKPDQPLTLRWVRRDGQVIWTEQRNVLITDPDGGLRAVEGIARDITERKTAEERLRELVRERESLLKEVHHRVKNNLQLVTSLLRLEAGRAGVGPTRAALQDMQSRIRSMALLHEMLYRTDDFGVVDLAEYLGKLANQAIRFQVGRNVELRLELKLAPFPVEIDRALTCGLIVSELLTNSLKHGFANRTAGTIEISLQPEAGGKRFRLRVADNGAGLPPDFDWTKAESLGLQLVSDLSRQLDGQLEVGPGPGADFAITFPATTGDPPDSAAPSIAGPGAAPLATP